MAQPQGRLGGAFLVVSLRVGSGECIWGGEWGAGSGKREVGMRQILPPATVATHHATPLHCPPPSTAPANSPCNLHLGVVDVHLQLLLEQLAGGSFEIAHLRAVTPGALLRERLRKSLYY